MVDLLRRSLAPLTEKAWQEIDDLAAQRLKSYLTARKAVDVDGPHGWEMAAVNTGRLEMVEPSSPTDVPWGIRKVLPLVEIRLPFVLNQMELDSVSRGCQDADLDALEDAVKKAALFEESAVYHGLDAAQLAGIAQASAAEAIRLPETPAEYPAAVAAGIETLRSAGIPEPYFLVLGAQHYAELFGRGQSGYPPYRIIRGMLQGTVLPSQALEGGILLSGASGHFELTLGQDWSIGYASHDRENVELYLTESFTFRVLEPAAAVELTSSS